MKLADLEPGQAFRSTAIPELTGVVEYHSIAGTTVTFDRSRIVSIPKKDEDGNPTGESVTFNRKERVQISSGSDVTPI